MICNPKYVHISLLRTQPDMAKYSFKFSHPIYYRPFGDDHLFQMPGLIGEGNNLPSQIAMGIRIHEYKAGGVSSREKVKSMEYPVWFNGVFERDTRSYTLSMAPDAAQMYYPMPTNATNFIVAAAHLVRGYKTTLVGQVAIFDPSA